MGRVSLIEFDRARGPVVAGADEAGRGCLAGPIVAAAVRFDYSTMNDQQFEWLGQLNDSKKLTPARREVLYGQINAHAESVAVIFRTSTYIDDYGLHRTNLHCLGTALSRVNAPGAFLISDGYMPFGLDDPCEAVVKGDATSAAIAAASIIAKVSRDRFMKRAGAVHQGWGFEQHMGYATASHQAAIGELGLSPLHRRSFASAAYEQFELVA